MTNTYRKKHGAQGIASRSAASGPDNVCCRTNIPDDEVWDAWVGRLRVEHPEWTRERVIERARLEALKMPRGKL